MLAAIDAAADRLAALPAGRTAGETTDELLAAFERLARAPAPDYERGALITIAALCAQLLGLPTAGAASAARSELERVASRAHHRLSEEGRDGLPSRYVLEHGLQTYEEVADLVGRDERPGLRQRAAELLGLSLVAADAVSPTLT